MGPCPLVTFVALNLQLIVMVRLCMALAFHIFAPVWQVSIKKRFDFGPRDHAAFMFLIGLMYSLSQGLVAQPLIKLAGAHPSRMLLVCVLVLGCGRPFALWTSSVAVVYLLNVPMVIALGVMNTAIAAACTKLADKDQLGGFYGVLESTENVAGMVGPTLGGLLSKTHVNATLAAVLACYSTAFFAILLLFDKHVTRAIASKVM